MSARNVSQDELGRRTAAGYPVVLCAACGEPLKIDKHNVHGKWWAVPCFCCVVRVGIDQSVQRALDALQHLGYAVTPPSDARRRRKRL